VNAAGHRGLNRGGPALRGVFGNAPRYPIHRNFSSHRGPASQEAFHELFALPPEPDRASRGRARHRGQPPAGNRHARRTEGKIRKWTPYRNQAGTMLGFVGAELASGMIVDSLKLMVGQTGSRRLAMPSVKLTGADGQPKLANGKQIWSDVIKFRDKPTRDRFQQQILDLLRKRAPEAFDDGEGAP
jgi:hypothetical protein